jgi:hypothetical protein
VPADLARVWSGPRDGVDRAEPLPRWLLLLLRALAQGHADVQVRASRSGAPRRARGGQTELRARSPGCVDSRVSPAPPANAHAIAPRCVVVAARRGTPDYDEKYDRLTFWEQLDGGTQYTLNKKFLTIIPIVLFLFTISNCAWLAS